MEVIDEITALRDHFVPITVSQSCVTNSTRKGTSSSLKSPASGKPFGSPKGGIFGCTICLCLATRNIAQVSEACRGISIPQEH